MRALGGVEGVGSTFFLEGAVEPFFKGAIGWFAYSLATRSSIKPKVKIVIPGRI